MDGLALFLVVVCVLLLDILFSFSAPIIRYMIRWNRKSVEFSYNQLAKAVFKRDEDIFFGVLDEMQRKDLRNIKEMLSASPLPYDYSKYCEEIKSHLDLALSICKDDAKREEIEDLRKFIIGILKFLRDCEDFIRKERKEDIGALKKSFREKICLVQRLRVLMIELYDRCDN